MERHIKEQLEDWDKRGYVYAHTCWTENEYREVGRAMYYLLNMIEHLQADDFILRFVDWEAFVKEVKNAFEFCYDGAWVYVAYKKVM